MTKTNEDLDKHILKDHPDIFRSVSDLPDGLEKEEKREETGKFETDDFEAKHVKKSADLLSEVGKKSVIVLVDGEHCFKCNFIATNKTLLNNHAIEKHSKDITYLNPKTVDQKHAKTEASLMIKCPGCGKSFGSLPRLERHYQILHSVEGKTCGLCQKTFFDSYSCKRHFKEVHCEKKMTQCPICDETIRSREIKNHLKNIHQQISPKPALPCELCGKSFGDSKSRKEHYQSVHEGKTCKCPKCEKLFGSSWHLKSHLQSIHNEERKVIDCLYCEKSFINFYSIGKHYKDFHGGKKINCTTFQKPL